MMRKSITGLTVVAILMASLLSGCGSGGGKQAKVFSSPEDLTAEALTQRMNIETILSETGHLSISTGDSSTDGNAKTVYVRGEDGITRISQTTEYADGSIVSLYWSNDPENPYLYWVRPDCDVVYDEQDVEQVTEELNRSMYTLTDSRYRMGEAEVSGDLYLLPVEYWWYEDESDQNSEIVLTQSIQFTIDPTTGYPVQAEITSYEDGQAAETPRIVTFDYSDQVAVDETAKLAGEEARGISK